eukprot:scaffold1073_cov383-Prasinococcus_capsulatus_cf.AAC.14
MCRRACEESELTVVDEWEARQASFVHTLAVHSRPSSSRRRPLQRCCMSVDGRVWGAGAGSHPSGGERLRAR